MTAPRLSIVSVNYKTPALMINAIRTVAEQQHVLNGGVFYAVDNHSGDGSAAQIKAAMQESGYDWVKVVENDLNGGFAYGSNAGIRLALQAQSDFVMLLNPDTEVRPGAIEALVEFLRANPKVGIVGSQLENADGGVESSAHFFHSPISELLDGARLGLLTQLFSTHETTPEMKNEAYACDWVSGSSMMVRREVFDQIGLLDEAFFLYFEEVDFFYRAQQAGWQTWYVPTSKVMHIEGASTGIKSKKRRPAYWYESRRRFFIKHHGVAKLLLADALWALGRTTFLLRRCLKLGAQQPNNDPKWLMFDLLTGDLGAVFSGKAWRLAAEKVR